MKSSFAQALLVALVAGVAAALMSGMAVRSASPVLMVSLLAPAPLMIAGFGWHPLAAALAGLVAALCVQGFNSSLAALTFAGTIAAPAFAVAALADNRFSMLSQRPQRDGKEMGGIGVVLVIFLALAGVLAALAIEPDFEALARRLRKALELSASAMLGVEATLSGPNGEMMARMFDLLSRVVLPASLLVTLATQVISATLAAQVAERAGLLSFPRPDFRRFAVPGGGMILIGLAFLVSSREGYLGAFGGAVLGGMLFLYLLQGLAVIHARTINMAGRGLLLFLAWGGLIVFGLPAFLFMLVGLADHLLDFRRGRF